MFEYFDILKNNFNGATAKEHTRNISQYYRSHGSSGYHSALEYIHNEIKKLGLDEVTVETFPLNSLGADNVQYTTDGFYPAWEPISVESSIVSPVNEKIVSYSDTPTCITWYSKSTPPGGITAEICDIGSGLNVSDYDGIDLKGKIALATGKSPEDTLRTYELAVEKFGAIGLISDCLIGPIPGYRTREITPDFVSLNRLSRKHNDSWAIMISGRKGARLRDLLANGPVKIHVELEAKTFDGQGETLIAAIKGSELPDEEAIVIGHVTNPRPNANCASGPALMIELARTYSSLISEGKIPRPKRTIRFLFVPEGTGSKAYATDHKDTLDKIVGAVCLCGVGQIQDLCKSLLTLSRTTDSVPSYLNDVAYSFLENGVKIATPPLRYREIPYSPFSDNSTLNLVGVPTVLIASEPNIFFHTQYLTWETTSEEVFNVSGVVVGGTTLLAANADLKSSVQIVNLTSTRSEERLLKKGQSFHEHLLSSSKKSESQLTEFITKSKDEIDYLVERDSIALDSCKTLYKKSELEPFINNAKQQLVSTSRKIKENLDNLVSSYGVLV